MRTSIGRGTLDAAEVDTVAAVDGVAAAAGTLTLEQTTFSGELPEFSPLGEGAQPGQAPPGVPDGTTDGPTDGATDGTTDPLGTALTEDQAAQLAQLGSPVIVATDEPRSHMPTRRARGNKVDRHRTRASGRPGYSFYSAPSQSEPRTFDKRDCNSSSGCSPLLSGSNRDR